MPCFILLPLDVFSRSGFYAIRSGFCSGRCAGDSVGEIVAAEAKEKQSEAGKSFGVGMPKIEEIASVNNDKSDSEPIDTRKAS